MSVALDLTDFSTILLKTTIVTYVTCHKDIKDCVTNYLTHIYVKCIMIVLFCKDFGYQDCTVNLYVGTENHENHEIIGIDL